MHKKFRVHMTNTNGKITRVVLQQSNGFRLSAGGLRERWRDIEDWTPATAEAAAIWSELAALVAEKGRTLYDL